MLNLILFGAPGSGKGTQSQRVAKHYGLEHISTGDLLREEVKKGTPLGKEIDTLISSGQFVADNVILDILIKYIDSHHIPKGIILDGFPRTVFQAKEFFKILEERKRSKPILVTLEVNDEELTRRILERGKISGRSDDNEETVRKRLEIYHSTTQPVIDFFKAQNAPSCLIEGVGDIQEVTERIINAVDNVVRKNSCH